MEEKSSWLWLVEIAVAVGTIVIAVIALVVSLSSEKNSELHRQLSVHPYLYFRVLTSGDTNSFLNTKNDVNRGITIVNGGLGPAIVKNFEIGIRNSHGETNWDINEGKWESVLKRILNEYLEGAFPIPATDRYLSKYESVGEKSSAELFLIRELPDNTEKKGERLDNGLKMLDAKIEYQSIYGVTCERTIYEPPKCIYHGEVWP